MKRSQILFIAALIICAAGCNDIRNRHSGKMHSPTEKYYITTYINQGDKTKADYGYVVIDLFDSDGKQITSMNTAVNSFKKWAVGWENSADIVVMYTREMGTFAWKIENDKLISIGITDDFEKQADKLREDKY
jgi:hypothetical protein